MIGLSILAVALLWTCFTIYLTVKIPRWLRLKSPINWLVRLLLVPAMLVGPFVDEMMGMPQFEQLCKESRTPWISADADQVKRARRIDHPTVEVPSNWIVIRLRAHSYQDLDTGKVFLKSQYVHTTGGRIASVLYWRGTVSCAPDFSERNQRIDIDKLIKEGEKS